MAQLSGLANMTTCQYCGSDRVVPVLDKNIEERDKPGNKYRRVCVACERFGRMASADEWEAHDDALVLPAGAPRQATETVPAGAYDDPDPEPSDSAPAPETAADGGADADDGETAAENEFDCPLCGHHCSGYPETCPECDAPFEWGDSA